MNILVTAGNTLIPIDRVRGITNIFTGRTGGLLAEAAFQRQHTVTLLTSHPEVVTTPRQNNFTILTYRTFDDLEHQLDTQIAAGFDAIIHCAAVSDFRASGVFSPAQGTYFDPQSLVWRAESSQPTLQNRHAAKVKSDVDELWIRFERTPKLVDFIRGRWGFTGILVKFKLEVGIGEDDLRPLAEQSRLASHADLIVGNTLEGMRDWALLGPLAGQYQRIPRDLLPPKLLTEIERLHHERTHA